MMCLGGGALAQPVFGWLMTLNGGSAISSSGLPVYSVASYEFAISLLMVTFVIGLLVSFIIKSK